MYFLICYLIPIPMKKENLPKKENPKKVPESNDRVGYGNRVTKSDKKPKDPEKYIKEEE